MSHGDVCCPKKVKLLKSDITNSTSHFARQASDMDLNATDLLAVVFQKHGSQTEVWKIPLNFLIFEVR